jgi:hypothetical protein
MFAVCSFVIMPYLPHPAACAVRRLVPCFPSLPRPQGNKSFFSEIIASISDIRFSHDGRYILSRDYMNLKLWDMAMESKPMVTLAVHEELRPRVRRGVGCLLVGAGRGGSSGRCQLTVGRAVGTLAALLSRTCPAGSAQVVPVSVAVVGCCADAHARQLRPRLKTTLPLPRVQPVLQLCDLYENDCIFDKFDCCMNGAATYVASGSYNNSFKVFKCADDGQGTPLEATRDPMRRRLQPVRVSTSSSRSSDSSAVGMQDHAGRVCRFERRACGLALPGDHHSSCFSCSACWLSWCLPSAC